uniref:HORMA domain-containing protein 1-like protein n=2 Tax=Callorhinchus milii TaxID=7868 RepID=V9L5R7_CALMI
MAVGVSCITYLRGIFPEDAYKSRYLDGMCVKILREDSRFPGASKVVKWLLGCFDALDKKYLRSIILGVHKDPEDPNSMIESYQFKFKYTTDGPKLDILSISKNIETDMTTQDTKKASILLIRKLFVLMQSLETLPSDVSLTMKLFYYDEVTPPDYQPPGFKAGECDSMWFEGTPAHFKIGDVPTPYYKMKVRITTQKEATEQLEKENFLTEEFTSSQQEVRQDKSILSDNNIVKEGDLVSPNNTDPRKKQMFSASEKKIEQLVANTAELDVSGTRTRRRKVATNSVRKGTSPQTDEEKYPEYEKYSIAEVVKASRAKKTISQVNRPASDSFVNQEKTTKRRKK